MVLLLSIFVYHIITDLKNKNIYFALENLTTK